MLKTAAICAVLAAAGPAFAQGPAPEPHKVWDISASIGLAATSGNRDTSQFNADYDLTYDPQTRNVVKTSALFLRGTTEGDLSAERFLWNVRDEFRVNGRAYVFAHNLYLRDRFKSISYMDALTGGVGYTLIDAARATLDVDGSLGGVWEKNIDLALNTSGAATAGEKFRLRISDTTTLTQTATALWKTEDFADSLYTLGVGVAVDVSTRMQIKFEVLDVYKNRPPAAAVQKNDLTTVVAIVFTS